MYCSFDNIAYVDANCFSGISWRSHNRSCPYAPVSDVFTTFRIRNKPTFEKASFRSAGGDLLPQSWLLGIT